MTSVESAVPVKTPEPDQYWGHVKSKDRVYFIGRNPEGEMVWQCEGDTVEVGNLDWSDWQHIPDCDGWDWEFEAFPHYYVGTKWCDGTAYVVRESPTKSHAVGRSGNVFKYDWDDAAKRFVASGTLVRITEAEAMARLDKPAEQWPKYYVRDTWLDAYVRRDGDSTTTTIGKDGSYKPWQTKFPDMLPEGWREVTKAEALARVKPVETWPKYYVTVGDSRHYYRCDSSDEVWAVTENGEERQGSPAYILLDTQVWKEVTEAEAKARVNPAGEWPKYVVNPDESCKWYIKLISENSAQHVSSTGIESPERWGVLQTSLVKDGQWVEVTEAEAFARVVKPAEPIADYRVPDHRPAWDVIMDVRDWLDPHPPALPNSAKALETIEQWLEDNPEDPHHDDMPLNPVPGKEVATAEVKITPVERTATALVAAVVEGPDDWVTQDRVPARDCIDRGWWGTDFPIHELLWWPVKPEGSAAGKMHGHVLPDGQMLNLICRRRDLPALPAPLPALVPGVATDRMVDLFLSWRLPSDFQPDGGISFTSRPIHESWPTGTNLFTASQARKMIEHLLSVPEETSPPAVLQPKRTPVRLWVRREMRNDSRQYVSLKINPPSDGFTYDEIKFDGSGFYVVEGE